MGDWFSSTFQNLFSFIFGWIKWLAGSIVNGLGSFFNALYVLLKNGFESLGEDINNVIVWLGGLIHDLSQSFVSALQNIFGPLIMFFSGLLYFITQVLAVIILVLKVILGLIGVLFGLFAGFVNTVVGFASWDGSATSVNSVFSGGFNFFLGAFNSMGGNVIAGVLAVVIWLIAVYVIFKIIGSND